MNPWNIFLANIRIKHILQLFNRTHKMMNFHRGISLKSAHNLRLWPNLFEIEPYGGKFLIDKNKRNDKLEKSFRWKNAEKYN